MSFAITDFINLSTLHCRVTLCPALAEINTMGSSAAASSNIQPSNSKYSGESLYAKQHPFFATVLHTSPTALCQLHLNFDLK